MIVHSTFYTFGCNVYKHNCKVNQHYHVYNWETADSEVVELSLALRPPIKFMTEVRFEIRIFQFNSKLSLLSTMLHQFLCSLKAYIPTLQTLIPPEIAYVNTNIKNRHTKMD